MSVSLLSYGKPSVSGYDSVVRNRVLSGMIEECRAHDLTLSLDYIDEDDAGRLASWEALPAAIRSGQSQGVLISGHFPGDAVAQLCAHLPCVQVADYSPALSVDCIDHDDMRSVELLVDHLWSLGHRHIGFIGGAGLTVDLIRCNAFCLAMLRRGKKRNELSERCRDVTGPYDKPEAAFGWVREAIQRGVTGWVATNDAIGYRVLRYLEERGIQCPHDLSLCGFDHFDPPTDLPKLTSIDAPFEDMGRLAVVRLHQRIKQTVSSTHHTMIECRIVPGTSTAPVPA
ncbi:MAG: LacI family DNA-binding transcriptional regulator [Planctomycetota bacterium]